MQKWWSSLFTGGLPSSAFISGKKKKVEDDNMTIDLVDDDNTENVGVPGAAMADAEKNDQVAEDEFGAKDYRYLSYRLIT